MTVTVAATVLVSSAWANGINRNGTDAASMAMGGTDVAWARSPLEAMGDNPAGLGFLNQYQFDVGGVAALAQGKFHETQTAGTSSGNLSDKPGATGEGAIGIPLGKTPITIGISFIPDSMLLADWHYPDPQSAGGITYGNQEDKSEILVLRSAIGMGIQLTPQLSLGLSLGADYNKNELVTPYIFQNLSAPDGGFNGAKTLLNLDTDGFGWNAQIGLLYRPLTNLQFGLSYRNKYRVVTTGRATGNAGSQFGSSGNPLYSFAYDAEVDNTFPDQFSLGGSWQFLPRWRVAAQVDWIDWANSFNTLPVKLSNGVGAVGGALGNFQDNIPLNWQSQFVYRAGLEFAPLDNLSLRVGYSYGHSPVPSSTLTPMTAAIMENTVTAGIGYRWRACQFDLAYQCDLPQKENVGTSALLSGEYSNSSTDVYVHWLALTMSVKF